MPATQSIDMYPQPRAVEVRQGNFTASGDDVSLRLRPGAPQWVQAATAMAAKEVSRVIGRKVVVRPDRGFPAYTAAIAGRDSTKPKPLRADRSLPPGTADQGYEMEIRADRIVLRASGWAGLAYAMLSLLDCCNSGLGCARVSDSPRFGIRAFLVHLSYNQWKDKPDPAVVYGYSDKLRFDRPVFDDVVTLMARLKMNMIVLDLGDAIRYHSHPEIAVKGALTPKQLGELLRQCRDLGLEPIPKLNFATTHDVWLKEYRKMVGTEQYHRVCNDLITEVIALFDRPRFFHIGMDEEDLPNHRGLGLEHIVIREGQAWLDAVNRFDETIRKNGSRTWMWGDPLWPGRRETVLPIPKHILVSDWNYSDRKEYPTSTAIVKMGYDNIPTASNWTVDRNASLFSRFAAERLDPRKVPGMLMTVWNPTLQHSRHNLLNAVSLAAGAFWNPDGPSRAPWPRDHIGGQLRKKD
jgi:hypothetical protein